MPLLAAFNSIPKIAVAPLFVIWFGLDYQPKILLAFLLALFPIFVNSLTGLGEIEPDMIDLSTLAGGTPWRIFLKVRLMNAIPYITDAMKVAFPLALVGSIVGSLLCFLFGVVLIRAAAATTTVVSVSGPNGRAALRLGKQLGSDEIATLEKRLSDDLDYPIARRATASRRIDQEEPPIQSCRTHDSSAREHRGRRSEAPHQTARTRRGDMDPAHGADLPGQLVPAHDRQDRVLPVAAHHGDRADQRVAALARLDAATGYTAAPRGSRLRRLRRARRPSNRPRHARHPGQPGRSHRHGSGPWSRHHQASQRGRRRRCHAWRAA